MDLDREPNEIVRAAAEQIRTLNTRTLVREEAYTAPVRVYDTALALSELTRMLPQALTQLNAGLGHLVDQGDVHLFATVDDVEDPVPGDTVLERRHLAAQATQTAHGAVTALALALDEITRITATMYTPVPHDLEG